MQSRITPILVSCNIGITLILVCFSIGFAPILVRLGTAPILVSLIRFVAFIPILVQLLIKSALILVRLLV